MHELLADAAARAGRYLDRLADRPVFPAAESLAGLAALDEPLPELACDAAATLELLDRVGSPATVASAGGRYFGFVIGGTLPAALAAHVLASAWDQNAGLAVASPVATRLRSVVSRWLVELFGLPRETEAMFVGGATEANLAGLVAARDRVLANADWNATDDGLCGAPPITVVVSEAAHSTVGKSLAIAGLGRNRCVTVPADAQGRMRAEELPDCTGPTIVVAQAGNVNSGAFDPLKQIVDWARQRDAWVHVDGAFGLWAAASPARRHLTEGIDGADSWATDGHKWLNVPYDSGMILMRDPSYLLPSMSAATAYFPAGTLESAHHTPQSSQRARAVDAWAAIRSLGRAGVAELVERCCQHATRFARGLQDAGHEVLNDVVLNQVLVRFGDDRRTDEVMGRLQRSGECWCGSTTWQGRLAMRISVSSWATTTDDVERSLRAMLAAAR
ncbi:MAG: aspartate aminotransferase family protein [Pirellulales bacterium]